MFTKITFAIINGYYLPFMYTMEGSDKPISVSDLIRNNNLPAGYGFIMMMIPNDVSVPEHLRYLCVPLLCELKPEGTYPLMCEAYTKYGVSYYPQDRSAEIAEYLSQVHAYVMGGKSPLGDVSSAIVDYNTMYSYFYNSYTHAQQAEAEKTVQEQATEEPVQEEVVEEAAQEAVQEETVEEAIQEEATQEPVQEVVVEEAVQEEIVEEPVQEEVVEEPAQETVQKDTEEKQAVVGFGEVATTPKTSTGNIENFLNLKTNNSGNYIEITSIPTEEIERTRQILKSLPQVPESFKDIPAFIPNVYKYDKPVGAVDMIEAKAENPDLAYIGLSGISLEELKDIIEDFMATPDNNIKDNPQLNNFKFEMETLFNNKIPLRKLFTVFNPDFGDNIALLYELMKYVVIEESPNGLYDNLYHFIYLLEHELKLQGKSNYSLKYKIASVIAGLACDVKNFEGIEENISTKDDDNNSSDGTLKEAGIIMDTYKEQIRYANDTIRDLVTDLIASDKPVECKMVGGEDLSTLRKVCILSSLGLTFMIKENRYLAARGFDILNVLLGEYAVHFTYFGISIDHTALGDCIRELSILEKFRETKDNEIGRMTEEQYAEEYKRTLEESSYNVCLHDLKTNNVYASAATKSAADPVDLRNLKLSLEKVIVAVYNNKPIPVSVVLKNDCPTASINERLFLCPCISALYKEMANCGITVADLFEKPEQLKHVKYYRDNGCMRELNVLPIRKEHKAKFVPIHISNPLLTLQEVYKHVQNVKIPGCDTRAIRIPSWIKGDVDGISEGFKTLFDVV